VYRFRRSNLLEPKKGSIDKSHIQPYCQDREIEESFSYFMTLTWTIVKQIYELFIIKIPTNFVTKLLDIPWNHNYKLALQLNYDSDFKVNRS